MLDAAFQSGTDQVLQDMLQRPAPPRVQPPKFSFWSTVGAGLGGIPTGVAEMGASAIEVFSGLSRVDVSPEAMAESLTPEGRARQQTRARETLETGFRDNDIARSLRSVGDFYMPDPATAHTAEVVVADFLRVATKAVGSMVAAGPLAGAVIAGAEEGFTQSDKLAAEGVDVATRSQVGAVTGAVTSVGLALPVAGRTWAQTIGLAAVGGPASFIGQNAANRAILEAADYDKQAQQFDPFDPVGLALSTLLPFGFGAVAMRASRTRTRTGPPPAPPEVEDAARVNLLRENVEAHRLTPETDLSPAHEQAVSKALEQMAAGQRVDVADVVDVPPVEAPPAQLQETVLSSNAPPVEAGFTRLYRAESPTVKFSDVFKVENLTEFKRPEGMTGKRYTSDFKVADYYRSSYGRDAVIRFVDVPDAALAGREIAAGEYIVDVASIGRGAAPAQPASNPSSPSLTDPLVRMESQLQEVAAAVKELEAQIAPPREAAPAQPATDTKPAPGKPRDLTAELVAARKTDAVLKKLMECLNA